MYKTDLHYFVKLFLYVATLYGLLIVLCISTGPTYVYVCVHNMSIYVLLLITLLL